MVCPIDAFSRPLFLVLGVFTARVTKVAKGALPLFKISNNIRILGYRLFFRIPYSDLEKAKKADKGIMR